MVSSKEITGLSGELYATAILMTGELFYAILFGGKVPSFDIMAEVNDDNTPFPLFIQVKSTQKLRQRYNKSRTYINTPVPDDTIKELAAMPIPTYVAGFDLVNKILYVAPVFSGKEHYPSIPTKHKIKLNNKKSAIKELSILKNDVVCFFKNKTIDFQSYKQTYNSQL